MYGRTFRLVNADGFTTKFYSEKLDVELGEAEPFPEDPYSTMRETAHTHPGPFEMTAM